MIDDIEQSGQDARTTVGPIEGVVDVSEVRVTQPRIDFDTLQRQFANVGPRQNPLIPAPNEAPEIDQDALNIVNQSRDAMQASLMNATQYSPDEAAEAQRLGAPMKLNYDLVLRNKDQVKHAAMMQDIDRRDLMRNDPILARQLQNLDFAAIAYDDLDNLSQNGSIFKDIASAIGGRPWEMQVIPREIVRGYLRGEAVAERGRVGTQIMLEGETAATAEQVRQLRESMMQLEQFGESGFLSLGAEMVAQNVAGIREVAATTLTGAAIGTGIFPGVGTMGGAYGGFQAGSFLTTARMEAGNAYLDMIEAGVNEDDAKYAAIGTGLVNGLIEVAFQKFAAAPFKGIANKLLRNQINQTLVRPTTRKALADAAKSYVTTVAGEAGEEGLQQLTNIVNRNVARTMSGMDPDVTASQAGAEIVDSFIAGAMGSAIIGGAGPTINVYADIVRANAATRQADFFERLNTNAAAAKVRARNATAYEQFLAAQAQGTNAETIYVDGTVAQGILRQSGITPQQLDAVVPGLYDRVREAAAAGGDVQIPTAQYGARMAGTELGNALTPHLRLAPDAMSAEQAQQFAAEKQNLVDEAKRILEEKKTTETAFVNDALAFEERILAQITEAGKTLETPLTKTQAQAAAKVYQAMYVNLAARAGKTVTQLEQEIGSPLQIRGAQAVAAPLEQADQFDQAGQRRTDTPEFKSWFGQSKVVDAEGKPLVVYHGTDAIPEGTGFTTFFPGLTGNFGRGIYFSPSPEVAGEYAGRQTGAQVLPVYVSLQNPLRVGWEDTFQTEVASALGLTLDGFQERMNKASRRGTRYEDFVTQSLQKAGFDGVIATNSEGKQYVVAFDPKQIKSVNNRGTWSRTTANIMEQASRIDADYMAAVERGDMATAQRMVDDVVERWIGASVDAGNSIMPSSGTTYGNVSLPLYRYVDGDTLTSPERGMHWTHSRKDVEDMASNSAGFLIVAKHPGLDRVLSWESLSDRPMMEREIGGYEYRDRVFPEVPIRPGQMDIVSIIQVDSDGNRTTIKSADAITRDEAGNVVPLSQRFDITSPRIFEQTAVPAAFYSALGRAIDGIDIKSASASGWKERIKGLVNKGEIKQDELNWSGLEDWLSLPREGKITKDEVAAFLKNNGVRVERVTTGAPPANIDELRNALARAEMAHEEALERQTAADRGDDEAAVVAATEAANQTRRAAVQAKMALDDAERPLPTKYAQYTLPGGTNYREVLLTLPVDTEQRRAAQDTYNRLVSEGVPLMEAMERAQKTLPKEFRSQHWTQPNVVAHLRMNDRVDADGKRVLFVEEIQSDWAQAGRKKGFRPTDARRMELIRAMIATNTALEQSVPGTPEHNAAQARMLELEKLTDEFNAQYRASTIPIAPFIARQQFAVFKDDKEVTRKNKEGKEVKQRYSSMKAAEAAAAKVGGEARDIGMQADTEGWVNLALKQIMLEAVNGGYDRVAFINGEQSKDRYDLAKQVRLVSVNKQADGRYLTYIEGIDGTALIRNRDGFSDAGQKAMTAEELEATVGKEVATQAIEGKPNKEGWVDVRGDNLRVGGEGMVAFYDKIVPAATSKLLEKLDGGKLGEIRLPYMLPKQMEADADRLGMTQADILEVASEEDAYAQNQSGFDVTDALREKVASGLPLFQEMPGRGPARGGIDVTTLLITLGKSADITTLGHEAAHAYFEILGRLAAAPNAPEFFRNDMDILLRFGKIAGDTPEARLATWNATTLDGRRKLHEAFAYNFEIYLFEGKSPSVEMQGLFDRFASWLKRVYKSLRDDLNAIYRREFGEDMPVLTGEVREVMDRMLASDEQIKRQREVQGMKPLLTGRPDGMSDTDWAEYQLLSEQDVNAAIQKLTEASVRNMEWLSNAKSRLIKSLQAKHAKLRKEMRERIATEVAAQPEYRTLKYLRTGMMQAVDGTEVQAEGVTKLNAARVDEIANATTMAQMFDTTTIPKGITVEGGQDPDVVAEMFGFSSGSDMILRISAAKPIKEAIAEQLDARMEAEYGNMFTPAEVEKQVNKALHNEVRARMVATELKWAAKATQPVRAMLEAARQVARETIGSTLVGELKPAQFIAAEARAAKDALGIFETPMEPEAIARSTYSRVYNRQKAAGATEEAAVASATAEATTAAARAMERVQAFRARYKDGDREQLIVQAKRRQLLQNQLASAAIETQEEIDKAIKGFRKFFKADAKIAESRDLAMVMAARAILASRGIGRSDKAPAAYVEQLQANNPGLYAELAPIIMRAGVGDYRKMTVSEFRVIAESVEALWSRARRDRQIQVGEQKVELDLVVSEMIAAMSKIKRPAVQPGVREAVGFKDVAKRQAMEVRAANRRVESWSDALDAADPKRPFTTYLWQPVKDAVVRFRQIRNDKVKKLYELVMQLDIPKNSIDAPELDYTFGRGNAGAGKAELLGAMLHAGNESNYRKLLLGRQWATLNEAGNMDDSRWKRFVDRMIAQGVLTKADFDFLQAVWDLNEEIKPLLQKAHYDLEGYYFKEVQASPVVTPFGTYRGGYVPAATDRFMVADAVQRAGMQELEQDWRFSLPSTGMGMTKARVESYTKPLALDIRLIVTHVDAALRFAIIQPAIVDALKILKNRSFAAEIDKIDPTAITAMLLPWLNRSAHQTVSQPGRFKSVDAFWRGVRTRTGMSIMFANLRNAFQQITGLFPSAVKVSPVYLKNAVTTYLGDPRGTANIIAATDPFMDQRMRDQVYEMQEQMNDLLLNPSKFDKVQAWNKQHAYFIQTAFQNQVDIITWLGAYNQSLAESGVGVSEEKARKQAIRDAGAAVRLTQGSIMPEDISAFEAGTPFYRTFTQFAGYFNGIANLNATEMVKTVRTMGFRGGKGKLLYIYLLGFAMPAIVSDAIVRSMGGGWDDDDEDGYLDVFMDWFFGSQIRMGAAFIPFGSTALQAITTPFDNKPYNDRMNNSPSIQALESATIGTGKAIVNVVDDDKELTGKNVRDVLTAVSLATGIPVSVLGRPAGYLVDVYRGEIEPEGPIDFTLGILTGTTAPSTRR